MASSPLRISASVDVAGLKTGLDQAATVVDISTKQMAGSFKQLDESSTQSIDDLKAQLASTKASLEEAGAAGEASGARMASGFHEARGAAKLLNEELGIHMNRELTSVLAKSTLLGPALQAAFGAVAVAGFVEIAVQAGEKLGQLIADTFIYTKAQQDLYAEQLKDNTAIIALNEEHLRLQRELAVEGLTANERAKLELQFQQDDAKSIKDKVALLEQQSKLANQTAAAMSTVAAASDQNSGFFDAVGALAKGGTTGLAMFATNALAAGQGLKEAQMHADDLAAQLAVARKEMENTAVQAEVLQGKIDPTKFSPEGFKKAQEVIREEMFETFNLGEAQYGDDLAAQQHLTDTDTQLAKELAAVHQKTYEEMATDAQAAYDKIQDAAKTTLEEELRIAKDGYAANEKADEDLVRSKQVTAQQLADIQKAQLAKELALETAAIQQRMNTLGPTEIKEYQALQAQLLEIKKKNLDQQMQAQRDADTKMYEEESRFYQQTQTLFNNSLDKWITGQQKFGQSMKQVYDQLLNQFIMMIVKMAEQWAVWIATQKAYKIEDIIGSAHQAAAKAFASAPNPIIGVIEAAAAFGAVMSYAAFEQGGIVPKTDFAMLHKNEMVLPAHIASHVEQTAGGQGGGGDTHVHMSVNAMDSSSFARVLSSNSSALKRTIRGLVGNGAKS